MSLLRNFSAICEGAFWQVAQLVGVRPQGGKAPPYYARFLRRKDVLPLGRPDSYTPVFGALERFSHRRYMSGRLGQRLPFINGTRPWP